MQHAPSPQKKTLPITAPNAPNRAPPTAVFDRATFSGPLFLTNDVIAGAKKIALWKMFAWQDIQNRYRRSKFGVAWIALTHVMFIAAIVVFFSGFSDKNNDAFVHYISVGFAVFSFILANITDGGYVFINSKPWLLGTNLPTSVYVYKSVAKSVFTFVIQLLCSVIIISAFGWRPSLTLLWLGFAAPLILINVVVLQFFLGYLAARFRDVVHIVGALTRFLFFTTPILWVYDESSGLVRQIATLNPLTHYIEIFRSPFLGESPSMLSLNIVFALTIFGILFTSILASKLRSSLPYLV